MKSASLLDDPQQPRYNNRFNEKNLLTSTSTSAIYIGWDSFAKRPVIIKKLGGTTRGKAENFCLLYSTIQQEPYVPKLLWSELDENELVLIFEAKGISLQQMFKDKGEKFTNLCIFYLADKMLCLLQRLHDKKIIHGNLKPSKFLLDLNYESSENLYLIAFDKAEMGGGEGEKKIKLRTKLDHNKFTSIAGHHGSPLSPKDDLESLGYIILYFLKEGKMFNKKMIEKYDNKIKFLIDFKFRNTPEELCAGLPGELCDYFRYVRSLKTQDKPDYDYLRSIFWKLCQRIYVKGEQLLMLDWLVVPPEESERYRSMILNQLFSVQRKLKRKKSRNNNSAVPMKDKDGVFKIPSVIKGITLDDDKDSNDFYRSPIFETNQENTSKFSVPSTHRSIKNQVYDEEDLLTERKKLGEQVFVTKYSHAKLSKIATESTNNSDWYKNAVVETVQTHRYPCLNQEAKEKKILFEDSVYTFTQGDNWDEKDENVPEDDDEVFDAEGNPIAYFELMNDDANCGIHSNPSALVATIKQNAIK